MSKHSQPVPESHQGSNSHAANSGSPPSSYPDSNQVPPNAYSANPETNQIPVNPDGANPGQVPLGQSPNSSQGLYPLSTDHQAESAANSEVESRKTAIHDAASVLKPHQRNPTNGLQATLTSLGDQRVLNVGMFLCCTYVLFSWLATIRIMNNVVGFFASFLGVFSSEVLSGSALANSFQIADHLKIILTSALSVIAMIGIFLSVQKLFKGQANFNQIIFITAITILPFTMFSALITLIGAGNLELLLILAIFASTTTILVIHNSLKEVLRLSARTVMVLVPVIVLAVLYIQKLLSGAIIIT